MSLPRGVYRGLAISLAPILVWLAVGWLLLPWLCQLGGYPLRLRPRLFSYVLSEASFGAAIVSFAYWWANRKRKIVIFAN